MRSYKLAVVLVAVSVASVVCVSAAAGQVPVRTISRGATFTLSGRTGSLPGESSRATGRVVMTGHWQGGRPYPATVTFTDAAGRYRLHVQPERTGLLTLRLVPPDHVVHVFVLRVV